MCCVHSEDVEEEVEIAADEEVGEAYYMFGIGPFFMFDQCSDPRNML